MEVNEHGLKVKPRMSAKAYVNKLLGRGLSEDGREKPDPTPMAPPVGFFRQPSMIDHIRNMVRSEELRKAAMAAGQETFEEADDFDVPDDEFPASPHEVPDDLEGISTLRERQEAASKHPPAAPAASAAPAQPPAAPVPAEPPTEL